MAENDVLMLSVSGCRGIVGSTLTPPVVAKFAGSIGSWLRERAGGGKRGGKAGARPLVVIGRDGRAGGHVVRDAAVAGLAAAGCDVIDLGIAMTPTVGVLADELGAAGGLVLTASHNPQQWNGIKPMIREVNKGVPVKPGVASASAPPKAISAAIIDRYSLGEPAYLAWDEVGTVTPAESVAPVHLLKIEGLLKDLGVLKAIRKRKFSVVLDSVNGAGAELGGMLMNLLECRFEHQGAEASGLFPHTPEPTAENLKGLCRSVKKAKAQIGFAQDPDADRLAIVDEKGRYIGEEYTLVLATRALAELGGLKKGSKLAVNLSTSRMIDDLAAQHKCVVVRTAVGEANVVEAMKRDKSVIGGEGNGGVIWPAVTYIRDSLGSMALVMALMAKTGKSIGQLVQEVPAYAIEKRKVTLKSREEADAAVRLIAAEYSTERLDQQDGVRVDFADKAAWLHVRASNTEPIMRLIAEAPTVALATAILDEAARVIG